MSHRDVAFRAAFWTDPDQRHAALRAAAAAYDRAWRADPFKPNVLSGADTAEERHDLRWDEDLTVRHAIRNGGCTLIRMADPLVRSDRRSWASLGFPWASGQLLDACAGQNLASWLVRVDCSEGNRGFICIGVCEPTACCAWGLSLCTGMLERNTEASTAASPATPHTLRRPFGLTVMVLRCSTTRKDALLTCREKPWAP